MCSYWRPIAAGAWATHTHPRLQGLRRWSLATRDAHGLYARHGWTPLPKPEIWMQKFDDQANPA